MRSADATRRHFLACTAGLTVAFKGASGAATAPLPEAAATHNMMVFGQSTMYLSHLPMFDRLNPKKTDYATPHRFQVLLEATLSARSGSPQKVYFDDRGSHPDVRMYTLRPEKFVLATLFPPDPNTALKSFPAEAVFRGHLERTGNAKILDNVTVNVERVIHSHKFLVGAKRPEQLEYIVFGKGEELFAAHMITAPPDFDQILPLRITGRTFTPAELNRGVRLVISDHKNVATARLKRESGITAVATAAGAPAVQVKVDAATELYFEDGELFIPPQFPQTADEKKAGFTEEQLP